MKLSNDPEGKCSGPCHRSGQGRRRSRMLDPGMLRYIVLQHIAQHPRHGYELIKLLEQQSGGIYSPSPGMIYPMLAMLEDLGHVSVILEGNKKLYVITEQGQAFLEQNRAMVVAIEERIATRCSEDAQQIREHLHLLRDAVIQRIQASPLVPEQFQRIKKILEEALTEIQTL
ncbi:hypothetical protein A6M27_15495 [Acidithiobacillus thiooxidans]|uniref:Transcription regulator PadR N-terminal domain-containing protein n=2 Tax=Acidithiobacillus thiooxidans TaxID=930 RepID=A0A1C2ICE6_ACITH|nr:hypothetical protein A6O24_19790 [Acidithiobacillus thiooxidans]OCX71525.1 hypothetical protein A6M23_11725 [Acidithiobacillus thiooxidans]OCX73665.1 hypothetical protein A6P07_07915 [Acidithiobacillus thiooxidans]OCX84161.1 hypothetical protein A6P08_09495 [Acidithiobacillus thiooxidans]OCX84901.1 hypothetical protein A6M27_15495 [Acidithiobacillus thiooxidans]